MGTRESPGCNVKNQDVQSLDMKDRREPACILCMYKDTAELKKNDLVTVVKTPEPPRRKRKEGDRKDPAQSFATNFRDRIQFSSTCSFGYIPLSTAAQPC